MLVKGIIDEDFLNYKKTVPAAFKVEVKADRHLLQRTVERVSLIIDDKIKNPLRCRFGMDELRIVCATSLGKAEDVCVLEGDGQKEFAILDHGEKMANYTIDFFAAGLGVPRRSDRIHLM